MSARGTATALENSAQARWAEANQSCLVLEFARLRFTMGIDKVEPPWEALNELRRSMQTPPAIDQLAAIFELSGFERDLLLLCAGVEMDSALASECAKDPGRPQRGCTTFATALASLSDPHWSALAPGASLRRYRLVQMEAGYGLTAAPLRIEERLLHFLAGVNRLDARLEGLLRCRTQAPWVAEEHRALASAIAERLQTQPGEPTILHLCGDDARGQEDVAVLLAEHAGLHLFVLRQENFPAPGIDTDQFVQLWSREALLLPALLMLQLEPGASAPAARHSSTAAGQVMDKLPGPLIVASRERLHRPLDRYREIYEVNKPRPAGQKLLWQRALGPAAAACNGQIDNLAEQFRLSAETIFSVAHSTLRPAAETPAAESSSGEQRVDGQSSNDGERLWNACCSVSRLHLDDLAQRIPPGERAAQWDDLILPELQMQTLRQMTAQLRYRLKVHETWGFASRSRRGLGLSALFSGASGTGKTFAAEVLAAELNLDLYRVDLSGVVSKYIGETEKNLKQVFDAAEGGGVLLLFDEADALFGKRAEVRDSRDRYGNMEIGYLLQRMETFEGMAILTSNLKSSLDKAFQRRLRFIVDFPFPDAAQREAIWARIFPAQTPTHDLDLKRLAQLNMAGGNIRNIALNAAFLAVEISKPVEMAHVLQATRLEANKIERPLSESEIRGWL
jgi:hypothetical protein